MLLAKCAGSDGAAFRRLYDSQASIMYGVALRITRDSALAADAVHDAMLQVWRNSARFDPARGNGRAWLISLVRYRAIDLVSRTKRETVGADLGETADPEPLPLERLLASSDGAALHYCLEQVEPARRRLVVLAFIDGLTHAEVAQRVAQPLGTVKSAIRRALLALKSCLSGLSQ